MAPLQARGLANSELGSDEWAGLGCGAGRVRGDTCVWGGGRCGTRTKNWDKVTNLGKEGGKVPPPSAGRGTALGGAGTGRGASLHGVSGRGSGQISGGLRMRRANRTGRSQTLGHVRITRGGGGGARNKAPKVCLWPVGQGSGSGHPEDGWGVPGDEAAGNRHPLQEALREGGQARGPLLLVGPGALGSRQEDKLFLLFCVCAVNPHPRTSSIDF